MQRDISLPVAVAERAFDLAGLHRDTRSLKAAAFSRSRGAVILEALLFVKPISKATQDVAGDPNRDLRVHLGLVVENFRMLAQQGIHVSRDLLIGDFVITVPLRLSRSSLK